MICAKCSGEMSKKWTPKSATKVTDGSTVIWECGVCGCQLTQAEIKSAAISRRKPGPDPSPVDDSLT